MQSMYRALVESVWADMALAIDDILHHCQLSRMSDADVLFMLC
jgi:hypothetical protein